VKKRKSVFWLIGLLLVVIIAGTIYYWRVQVYRSHFSQLETVVDQYLKNLGFPVLRREIKESGIHYFSPSAERTVDIPFSYSLSRLTDELEEYFGSLKTILLRWEEKDEGDIYHFKASIGFDDRITHRLDFLLRKAKIALLIDDFGYRDDEVVDLFLKEIDVPLTISIIPGTPFARALAEKGKRSGKEIMLHLPMQPQADFHNDYRWIILKGMSQEEIRKIFREALKDAPQARGVNNHMGSLITTREDEMKPLLEEIKELGLYFVDSKTASNSIAYSLAQEMGVRTAQNKFFLDNEKRVDYVRQRLEKMVSSLDKAEKVIGLGHIDMVTGEAILSFIANLDKRKVKLVFVSEIVE